MKTRLLLMSSLFLACAHMPPAPPPATALPPVKRLPESESFRAQVPAPLELPVHFEAPVPVQVKLQSGAQLWIYERHQLPLVSVVLVEPGGVDHEDIKKAGLADFTASMLTEGTARRSSEKIATELEDLAIDLGASAGAESTSVGLSSLSETLEQGMDVFADVVMHPAFRAADFQRLQRIQLTELEQKQGVPEALAHDAMAAKLYGEQHPWGQPGGGTPATVKALKPQDLAAFHKHIFTPEHAVFVVVGDITQDAAVRLLNAKFKGWNAKASPAPQLPPFPTYDAQTVTVLDRPGSQAQLWVGGPLFAANSPQAIPARLSNLILGGMFSSRLNQALREDKGYSYGFFSSVQMMRSSGTWLAAGSIESRFLQPALNECLAQLKRYASEGPTEEELQRARERYIGSLPGMFETNGATAGALVNLVLHEQPVDYFRTLPDRVQKTTRDEVLSVNRDYLKPDRWPVVIVGPKASLEAEPKKQP